MRRNPDRHNGRSRREFLCRREGSAPPHALADSAKTSASPGRSPLRAPKHRPFVFSSCVALLRTIEWPDRNPMPVVFTQPPKWLLFPTEARYGQLFDSDRPGCFRAHNQFTKARIAVIEIRSEEHTSELQSP